MKKQNKKEVDNVSEAAARILAAIARRNNKNKIDTGILLGTVTKLSPFTVKFDDISFDITNLLINHSLLKHKRTIAQLPDIEYKKEIQLEPDFKIGDRVVGTATSGSLYIIFCKVVQS